MKIGIIGKGSVGSALCALLTAAGHDVLVGSRSSQDAQPKDAAEHGDVVILALPYAAAKEALPSLADVLKDKIVVDATNPLNEDWSPLLLGQETSAAEEIAKLLPSSSKVVKSFNTVFADIMNAQILELNKITVFVASDDAAAMETVAGVATSCGFQPVTITKLSASRYLEAMAHLNIELALGQGGGTKAAFMYQRNLEG